MADDYYADNSGDFILSRIAPTLTYNTNSTKKIVQVLGPCDWAAWDFQPATTTSDASWGPCETTAASGQPSLILGKDLGYSFEDPDAHELIFLFGDATASRSNRRFTGPDFSQVSSPGLLHGPHGSEAYLK